MLTAENHHEEFKIQVLCNNNRAMNIKAKCSQKSNLVTVPVNKWDLPIIFNCNARSICNKIDELDSVLNVNCVDIAAITETWLDDSIASPNICPTGYTSVRNDRNNRRGGGVMLLIKENVQYEVLPNVSNDETDVEALWIMYTAHKMPREFSHIVICVVYHPPQANNWILFNHIRSNIDHIMQKHPYSGLMLLGDFNGFKDSQITNIYNMKQIVDKNTRKNKTLDKIITNMYELYNVPIILPPIGRSDHNSVLCRPWPKCSSMYKLNTTQVVRRCAGHNERSLFVNAISNINWNNLYNMPSCQEKFDAFSDTITNLLDTYLPMKAVKRVTNDKPWVTPQYKSVIQTRQCFWMAKDTVNYNIYRNKANRMSSKLRANFYKSKVENLKNSNPNQWWGQLNTMMGRKSNSDCFEKIAKLQTDGDLKQLADKMGYQFITVSCSMPKLNTDMIPTPNGNISSDHVISKDDVETSLANIKLHKSAGPDDIPNWVLRDCAPLIAGPITSIFNASIRDGFLPTLWKSATVVPVNKVSNPKDLSSDFRPISLTPVISKVLERYVYQWLLDLILHKIDKFQFGALRGSSTTHALIQLIHDWAEHTDDSKLNNYVRILFLDYAKAFDRINPNILIDKLLKLGIPSYILTWIISFLTDRKQRVKLRDVTSDWMDIWGNVPQGTLLGILLFLIMINDLKVDGPSAKFVDDTTLYDLATCTNNIINDRLQTFADKAVQ